MIARILLAAVAAGGAFGLASSPAMAQGVPVTDAQGLTKMTNIENCFYKTKQSNDSRVSPTDKIKATHTTPGSAGQAGQVGSTDVTGAGAADGQGMSRSTSIGGQDYAPLFENDPSVVNGASSSRRNVTALNAGTVAQGLSATNLVSGALSGNVGVMQGISGQVGSLSEEQQAWDQNSGSRVSNISLWNQAIQGALMWARFNNQRLIEQNAGQAEVTRALTFVPTKAGNANATKGQETNGCDNTPTADGTPPTNCEVPSTQKGQ